MTSTSSFSIPAAGSKNIQVPMPLQRFNISPSQLPLPASPSTSNVRPGLASKNHSHTSDVIDFGGTFTSRLDIGIKAPVGSMSISPSHRDVCLAARSGLYIVDLDIPSDPPRFLPQGGLRSVADVQWAPHHTLPHSIVSTSAQKLLLWNLALPSESAITREVDAHTRAIADINWGVFNPKIIATAGIDGWIKLWDIQTPMNKDAGRFSAWGWGSGATQVKWNRKREHIIASSHDDKVLIWDQRMGSIPVTRIAAHNGKVYGLDWSRSNGHELITCSLDKSIKIWSIDPPNESSGGGAGIPSDTSQKTRLIDTPDRTIQTSAPVWRARFTPFGEGILSLPQAGETTLDLWKLGSQPGEEKVVKQFSGHTDKVKEFVWRVRGGEDLEHDDRSFQLLSWGRDQQLKFWPIETQTLLDTGHVPGGPIKVIMTRRGAANQTCRAEPTDDFPHLNSFIYEPHITAPLRNISTLSGSRHRSNRSGNKLSASSSSEPSLSTGSVSYSVSAGRTSNLTSLFKSKKAKQQDHEKENRAKPSGAGMTRGTKGKGGNKQNDPELSKAWNDNITYFPTARESSRGSGTPNGYSNRSVSRPSSGQEDINDREPIVRLETEWKEVLDKFNDSITIHDHDISGRHLRIGLSGPWGPLMANGWSRGPASVVIGFSFPDRYPQSSTSRPTAKSLQIIGGTAEAHQHLRAQVDGLFARTSGNALEEVLRLLLGIEEDEKKRGRTRTRVVEVDDSDSDSDLETAAEVHTPLTKAILQRHCGASFGPNGELVCFFGMISSPSGRSSRQASRSPTAQPGSRWRNASLGSTTRPLSYIDQAMSRLSLMIRTEEGKKAAPKLFDDGPSVSTSRSRQRNASKNREAEDGTNGGAHKRVRITPHLEIFDISSLSLFSRELGVRYKLRAGSNPRRVCQKNADVALDLGRIDHELAWSTLAEMFTPFRPTVPGVLSHVPPKVRPASGFGWSHTMPNRNLVDRIFSHFALQGDVQMIASVASVLLSSKTPPAPQLSPVAMVSLTPKTPDYFSMRPSAGPTRRNSSVPAGRRTPITRDRDASPSSQYGLFSSGPLSTFRASAGDSAWSLNLDRVRGSFGFGSSFSSSPPVTGLSPGGPRDLPHRERRDSNVSMSAAEHVHLPSMDQHSDPIPVSGVGFAAAIGKERFRPGGRSVSRTESPPPTPLSRAGSQSDPAFLYAGGSSLKVDITVAPRRVEEERLWSARAELGNSRSSSLGAATPMPVVSMRKKSKSKLGFSFKHFAEVASLSAPSSQPLLSPAQLVLADIAQHVYADLLFRWDLLQERSRLLQVVITPAVVQSDDEHIHTLAYEPSDRPHFAPLEMPSLLADPTAPPIGSPKPSCSFCDTVVGGMSSTCFECGHVSHPACFALYDSLRREMGDRSGSCPSGCGCSCALVEARQSLSMSSISWMPSAVGSRSDSSRVGLRGGGEKAGGNGPMSRGSAVVLRGVPGL